jgi:hypothetical protein
MQTVQQISTWFSKQKLIAKVAIGCSSLFMLCCICSVPIAILSPSTPTPNANNTSVAEVVSTPAIVQTEKPTGIPTIAPTDIPLPTDTPLPPPTPNTGIVGERRESGGIALTVLSVSKADSISIWTPESGNVFLIIEVLIENVSRDDETPYNPFYFSVKDGDGFEASTAIAAPDPSLQSGTLPKGDKVRGFVAFEVRLIATGFTVTYEPLVIFGGYEPIRINLGQ